MTDLKLIMASEGQFVYEDSCLSPQKYVEKKVPSVSETMPACSKNLESNVGFSRTKLDCLHESNPKTSAIEPTALANLKRNTDPSHNFLKNKVAMYDVAVTEQYVPKTNQFSSSSNFIGLPFNSVNKFQASQHGYGRSSYRDSKGHHISEKMPSSSYQPQGRKITGNSETTTELVRGPRASRIHFPTSAEKNEVGILLSRDKFNRPDFQIKYEQAKFFMIKSFSEDDIHKSIKYNVWASTPYGNSKLEAAFREAEAAAKENVPKGPIFLFFSVNGSGQFVGLAEMIGPIDFKKTMEFWHEGKWSGFFPVKWHVIKDIPNKYFQNIKLENNDNKPVTFSRDTQEIGLPQGLKMLRFFRSYPLGRSLLDDFEFYERKEKSLNNQRRRQQQMSRTEVHLDAEFSQMSISKPQNPSHGPEY